jgi:hypothetical protein
VDQTVADPYPGPAPVHCQRGFPELRMEQRVDRGGGPRYAGASYRVRGSSSSSTPRLDNPWASRSRRRRRCRLIASTSYHAGDPCSSIHSAVRLRRATPSVFHQRHLGRVL